MVSGPAWAGEFILNRISLISVTYKDFIRCYLLYLPCILLSVSLIKLYRFVFIVIFVAEAKCNLQKN